MTFIYLTVFREQKKGSSRCAAVAHLVPTWTTGKYRMDCYANENQVSVAALKTFVNALDLMPFKDDKITVVTNCHEFAWDMGLVLSGHCVQPSLSRLRNTLRITLMHMMNRNSTRPMENRAWR